MTLRWFATSPDSSHRTAVRIIRSVAAPAGFAIVLDGKGGLRATIDFDVPPWPPVPEPSVIVLNSADPRAQAWAIENAGLAPADLDALLGPVRRTWASSVERAGEKAAVLFVDEAPWPDTGVSDGGEARVLATRTRLMVLGDLSRPTPMIDRARQALRAGRGPGSAGEVFTDLVRFWNEQHLAEALDLDKATATLEDRSLEAEGRDEIETLHRLRRASTRLRRTVAGHRAAVFSVAGLQGTPVVDASLGRWRALLRQAEETVELVDGIIERLQAVDDHVQNQLSTMLGDRLYVLTLISAIFLPLSFMTGLLGVNIGGIPLREAGYAFPLLCLFLIVLAGGQYWIAKRLHWLPRQDPRMRRNPPH